MESTSAASPGQAAPSQPPHSMKTVNTTIPSSNDRDDRRRKVEQRAYELYLSRGGQHGSDWEDWLAAERELVTNRGGDEPSNE